MKPELYDILNPFDELYSVMLEDYCFFRITEAGIIPKSLDDTDFFKGEGFLIYGSSSLNFKHHWSRLKFLFWILLILFLESWLKPIWNCF